MKKVELVYLMINVVGVSALLLVNFGFFFLFEYVKVYRVWLNLCQLNKDSLQTNSVRSVPFNVFIFMYFVATMLCLHMLQDEAN